MTLIFISACATNQADYLASGKIERVWNSSTVNYIEISFNDKSLTPNHISYTFSRKRFGSLGPVPDPMPGDCVKVWFKQFNGSSIPYGNINPISCD